MNDSKGGLPNVSVQRRYTAGAVEGHLARGVLINPVTVQVYAGDLDVEADGSLPPLDVLVGPVDGEEGPVERFPVVAAAFVDDARLPGTGLAFLTLPLPSSYRSATADGVDLSGAAAELATRAGDEDGSSAYHEVVSRHLLPETAAAGDDLQGWLADVERAERLVPVRMATDGGPLMFDWPTLPHFPRPFPRPSHQPHPDRPPFLERDRPDPFFPFPFPWYVALYEGAAVVAPVLDLRESPRLER
jgi:hypothetical protein